MSLTPGTRLGVYEVAGRIVMLQTFIDTYGGACRTRSRLDDDRNVRRAVEDVWWIERDARC